MTKKILLFTALLPLMTFAQSKKNINKEETDAMVYVHMGLNDKYGKFPAISCIEAPGNSYIFKDVFPHGAEMESELTGYRVYVDNRQNIDLYGKRHARLELAKTHFYSTQEDLDAGYGNDVLWAGQSMGCGTLREFRDGHPQLIDEVATRGQRIISYGPEETIVEMTDTDWKGNNIRTRYIMRAGRRELEVQIEADAPLKNLQLCTGVQKVGADGEGKYLRPNTVVSWGKDFPDYGKKALYPEVSVGLAVHVPEKYFAGNAQDSLQWMCLLKLDKHNKAKYYVSFCVDFETFSDFHSPTAWYEYIKEYFKKE